MHARIRAVSKFEGRLQSLQLFNCSTRKLKNRDYCAIGRRRGQCCMLWTQANFRNFEAQLPPHHRSTVTATDDISPTAQLHRPTYTTDCYIGLGLD